MRRLSPLLCTFAALGCLQAAQPVARFDGARAFEDVRHLVAIGPRVAGSPGAQAARDYIRTQLQAVGVRVEEQRFEAVTPLGRATMVNLRATFPGASGAASQERLVIGGQGIAPVDSLSWLRQEQHACCFAVRRAGELGDLADAAIIPGT